MKVKKFLFLLLPALLTLSLTPLSALPARGGDEIWDGSVAESFAGGAGAETDPYLISNGAELAYLARQVNAGTDYAGQFLRLTADIPLNDTSDWESWGKTDTGGNPVAPAHEWTAIGNSFRRFKGHFDGGEHRVSGLYINTELNSQGLFGYAEGGAISNLSVEASYVNGNYDVGGVVGWNAGAVKNCRSTASVSGSIRVGGVAGNNDSGVLENCHSGGHVHGTSGAAGGIAGDNYAAIANCRNTGPVSGEGSVGGIVGNNYAGGSVADCSSAGGVSGNKRVGCIAGNNEGAVTGCRSAGTVGGTKQVGGLIGQNAGTVSGCCNMGAVSADEDVGGLVGKNDGCVANCHNTGPVNGKIHVGGLVGVNCIASVENSYNTGQVRGSGSGTGGVVGENAAGGAAANCYNIGKVTGGADFGGAAGKNAGSLSGIYYPEACCPGGNALGKPLSDAYMRVQETPQNAENFESFDFSAVWTTHGDPDYAYPELLENFHSGYELRYTIKFDANGGAGAPEPQTKTPGMPLTLSGTVPMRGNCSFLGWAASSDALAARYRPGDSFTADADTTLYAVWLLLGDTDGDGKVDDWDSVLLDRSLAGWEVTIFKANADMDQNETVDDWDSVLLARKLAGWK